ncbi:MAG TPA: hypothetical protein VG778_03620 [Blastocatellia bacterium]|nr:hypothetical protein [Blastocatellia bacterium]
MILNPEDGTQMSPAASRVAAAHRSAATIVFALSASVVAYVVGGLFLAGRSVLGSSSDQTRMMLIVVAVVLALGSIALRRTQLSGFRIQSVATVRGVDGLIKHFFTITLILAAIGEAIGLLAVLVALFGGTQLDVIVCGLVAGIVLLSNFPRRAAWERAVNFFAAGKPGSIG